MPQVRRIGSIMEVFVLLDGTLTMLQERTSNFMRTMLLAFQHYLSPGLLDIFVRKIGLG